MSRSIKRSHLAIGVAVVLTAVGLGVDGGYQQPISWQWEENGWGLHLSPADGDVGIGTDDPLARLHIYDGQDGGFAEGWNGYIWLGGASPANMVLDNNEIIARNGYGPGTLYMQQEGGAFVVHGNTPGVDRFEITSTGEVVIGEPSTQFDNYELQVDGNIVAQGMRISMDAWADHVFDPDYDLPSLDDLEADIERDRHLPGLPSADEVLSSGADVGEVTRELLASVERLTLHTIRQEKELRRLREQLADRRGASR